MASHILLTALLLSFCSSLFTGVHSVQTSLMLPFPCTTFLNTCNSLLYHDDTGLQVKEIASLYSVNISQISPIVHGNKQDYLITVPCSCKTINGTTGYFYDTSYFVQPNDTFVNVNNEIYSGQAWSDGGNEFLIAGSNITLHLVCGCTGSNSQTVVTYTVQDSDTLTSISTLLSSNASDIESMNKKIIVDPGFIDVGWVLYVPMEKNGLPANPGVKS